MSKDFSKLREACSNSSLVSGLEQSIVAANFAHSARSCSRNSSDSGTTLRWFVARLRLRGAVISISLPTRMLASVEVAIDKSSTRLMDIGWIVRRIIGYFRWAFSSRRLRHSKQRSRTPGDTISRSTRASQSKNRSAKDTDAGPPQPCGPNIRPRRL